MHQTYVDVAVMARQLQERYREYSRRKVGPFRMLVEQAYRTVLHSYGLDSNPSSDENENEGDGSDVEMMEGDNSVTNHLNNTLTDMYSKNAQKNDNELIDISSDESGNEAEKKSNSGIITIERPAEGPGTQGKLTITKVSRNGSKVPESEPPKGVIASFGPEGTTIHANKKRKLENNNVQVSGGRTPPSSGNGGDTASSKMQPLGSGPPRAKKYKKEVRAKASSCVFQDMGGMDRVLKELCELMFHMKHPDIYNHIGVNPPRGILLHGPPGCGKTRLANAIAGQLEIPIIDVPATELIGGVSGESEERIRDVFEQAAASAPCVLFIDEIDAISSNRINAQKDMERRIVAQLISSLDALSKMQGGKQVLVVGATNRPEVLDPALRRVGRFDHEISLGIPDRDEREEILITICDGLCLESPMDFRKLAELTPGYVGADLVALTARAASLAIKRAFLEVHRKKQEEAAKNIPIVDLLEDTESAKENGNKQTQGSVEKESAQVEASGEDPENLEVTIITDNDVVVDSEEPQTEKPSSDGTSAPKEVQETGDAKVESTAEAKANGDGEKTTSEVTPTDAGVAPQASEEEKKDEGTEKMETEQTDGVVATNDKQIDKDEKTAPAEEVVDAIDLDELPDEPEQTAEKPRSKDITLFELLGWLQEDTDVIMGNQLDNIFITLEDFKNAIKTTVPSAKREGFITVPDVTWDDIGSLRNIREELQLAVLAPVKFPEKLKALGLTAPSGVLLCGPPGCGKTLLAKAIANEAGINFISVKGPELMNMYVGESERAVRQCFQRARNSQPCVIFFDEFDSLCPRRSDATDGGSATRVVNQLLTEMDGVEDRKGVFLMAASNRPDIIDPAVLRPGRLDTVLYVGLPKRQDRIEIMQALTKNGSEPALDEDVDLNEIADMTEGFTGADLSGLIRQAALLRLKESISGNTEDGDQITIHNKHFVQALSLTKPSVSAEDQKIYEKLRLKYAAPRSTQMQE